MHTFLHIIVHLCCVCLCCFVLRGPCIFEEKFVPFAKYFISCITHKLYVRLGEKFTHAIFHFHYSTYIIAKIFKPLKPTETDHSAPDWLAAFLEDSLHRFLPSFSAKRTNFKNWDIIMNVALAQGSLSRAKHKICVAVSTILAEFFGKLTTQKDIWRPTPMGGMFSVHTRLAPSSFVL